MERRSKFKFHFYDVYVLTNHADELTPQPFHARYRYFFSSYQNRPFLNAECLLAQRPRTTSSHACVRSIVLANRHPILRSRVGIIGIALCPKQLCRVEEAPKLTIPICFSKPFHPSFLETHKPETANDLGSRPITDKVTCYYLDPNFVFHSNLFT